MNYKILIRYILIALAIVAVAFNGVYFEKLTTHHAKATTELKPEEFAQKFWKEQLLKAIDSAVNIHVFISELKINPRQTIEKYSNTKGITSTAYILVKGEGKIAEVIADAVVVDVNKIAVQLNTGIYFGNAVREVTGKIAMGDFSNSIDFNNVSIELNKMVKTNVIEPLKAKAAKGQAIKFTGILELNKENVEINKVEMLPIQINFK